MMARVAMMEMTMIVDQRHQQESTPSFLVPNLSVVPYLAHFAMIGQMQIATLPHQTSMNNVVTLSIMLLILVVAERMKLPLKTVL